jgi:hypothetical protein
MPKNLPDDPQPNEQPMRSIGQPPPLGEELIAKLQMAVAKARQKLAAGPASSDYSERGDS